MKRNFLICLLVGELFALESLATNSYENSFQNSENPVRSSQECAWIFEQMEVFEAWKALAQRGLHRPGETITVAQLDTGVVPLNPLMATNQSTNGILGLQLVNAKQNSINVNFVQPNASPWDNDPKAMSFGHGTSTASLMIGWSNETGISGYNFRGVAPWLKLMPIKVTDSVVMVGNMSTGGVADLKNLAQGIQLATQLGADIISISLGAIFDNENLIRTAVNNALDAGIIVVAAAGQTFPVNMIPLPARLPGVIAVSASSRDKKPWDEAFIGAHIAWSAPGDGICHIKAKRLPENAASAMNAAIIKMISREGEPLSFTDALVSSSGTSYSTAYTAAAAALWLQYHSPSELRRIYGQKNISSLFATLAKRYAMETPANWKTQKHGQGILNIRRLIEAPLPCEETDSRATCEVKMTRFLNFPPT